MISPVVNANNTIYLAITKYLLTFFYTIQDNNK